MLKVLAFADDLTGALEAGAQFAGQGLPSLVSLHKATRSRHPVQVIDTESRHLSAQAAARALLHCADASASIIYKKTDSSLRGNIAAELTALQQATGRPNVAYIAAYPALGRTVKDGHLFVNGTPVHHSEVGNDVLNPVQDSSIHRLLAEVKEVVIHDSETHGDVVDAVSSAMREPATTIIAGPASVAGEIARKMDCPRVPPPPFPRIRRCLIVNGSRHELSQRQIQHAGQNGWATTAASGEWRILQVRPGPATHPHKVASATGRAVVESLDASSVDALMIFGGDTAYGVMQAFSCPLLEPIGEVLPGVPVSRVLERDLFLITKAGAFGEHDVIRRIKEILNGASN